MNLSPDQINTIKKLISYKGFEEIDVQYEILDHMACRIEVLMDENPKLTLEDAFRKAHSEFGIFGFADMADSYKKGIQKKFQARYWASVRQFLTSYRIFYLIFLGCFLHFISQNFTFFGEPMTAPGWGLMALMITVVFYLTYFHRVGKKYNQYASFKHAFHFTHGIHLIFQFAVHGLRFFTGNEIPMELTLKGAIVWLVIFALLIGWISIFLLPKIIQEAADETQKLKTIYES